MGRNGDGIREASESSYEITFTYRGIRCRERIRLQPSTANRKRVENHLGAIRDSIDKGTFDYAVTFPQSKNRLKFEPNQDKKIGISEYLDSWLTEQEKKLKASTLQGYTKIINNLVIPQFKGKQLSEIKRPDIKKWLSEMKCSNKRLSNIQSCFRSALQEAVNDEYIEINPLYGWTYANKEAPKDEDDVNPLSMAEQTIVLNELTGQCRNMVQFFFWTGLRTSELVALNWDDIDWQRGVIKIKKSLTQASSEFEQPKTRAGNRDVKILAPAMEALNNQKQYTLLANNEIFQNPRTGKRWTGDQAIRKTVWTPALKRAKVLHRRPYQTRHTYASMMLTAGESIAWLAEQMGHNDWAMLRKTYARFIKDSIPDAGDKAVEMFSENAGIKAGIHAGITTVNQP